MVQKHMATAVRKKQIVQAARRLIIRLGAEHVTIRGIAGEVGISEAAIYRHFRSKKDILHLLLEDIEQGLIDEVRQEQGAEVSSLDTLDSILRRHLSAIEKRRGVRFQVIAEIISLGDKSLNRLASEMVEKYIGCIEQLLADCLRSQALRADADLRGTATILFCIVQGVVNIWALSGYSFDPLTRYEPMWRIVRQSLEST